MAEPPRQLVLDLPHRPNLTAEDFLVGGSNEDAFALLAAWPHWPGRLLSLTGPSGSGKSHLAAIWAARAGAALVPAASIDGAIVPDLAGTAALAIEDLDQGPLDEPALFHLVNLARERGRYLLATSAVPLERCGIATPDLLSRLRLAPSVSIGPPDDALLRAVLVKLLLDRQLVVETGVVDFVAARIERSFARVAATVAELDREALSRGRRVTRPIAAAVIARMERISDPEP